VGGNEKERKSVENILFFRSIFHMTDGYLYPLIFNINAILALIIMNKIRNELVTIATYYGNQITANQRTLSVILIH